MSTLTARRRKALMDQRREMFADAELNYAAWECEALDHACDNGRHELTKAALRAVWLEWAGDPPDNWRGRIPAVVEDAVQKLVGGVALECAAIPWVDESLMQRTICVMQRRDLFVITPRKAARMLCRIAALAQQGVQ